MLLRDRFWLWGHPEGCYNNAWGNTGISRMTPMEGCLYLGVRNVFMVPDGDHKKVKVNRRQYNKSFKTLRQVGWEFGNDFLNNGGDIAFVDEFIEETKDFPNIGCAVFDDFKSTEGESLSLETFQKIHDRFHDNGIKRLDTWLVLYTMNFGTDEEADKKMIPYLEQFDGIILWCWEEKDYLQIPEKFALLQKMLPGKRFMVGCYLWNFGESKPSTGPAVKWMLDFYYGKLKSGEIEGVVMHTNTMADLDLESYDVACAWMDEHGDEEFPELVK